MPQPWGEMSVPRGFKYIAPGVPRSPLCHIVYVPSYRSPSEDLSPLQIVASNHDLNAPLAIYNSLTCSYSFIYPQHHGPYKVLS